MVQKEEKTIRLQVQAEEMLNNTIKEQIDLLANWNKKNIDDNPEQVRRNIETIICAITCLPSDQCRPTFDSQL